MTGCAQHAECMLSFERRFHSREDAEAFARNPHAKPYEGIRAIIYDPDRPVSMDLEWDNAEWAVLVQGLREPRIIKLR